jgi:hypothetical protein
MTVTGSTLAAAALGLVGARFRLHGRDPATGLDCIGVLAAAIIAAGGSAPLPTGYTIRVRALPALEGIAAACGLAATGGAVTPGDVLAVRPGPAQLHLLIAVSGEAFVHAHAGLGRVAILPGPNPWPLLGHWRPAGPN